MQDPHPPIFFSGLKDPKRSANRIAKYGLAGWIGIQDTPDELAAVARRHRARARGAGQVVDDLEICSMIWFVITDEETDQTPRGKASNLLAGTAAQITDMLKRYKDVGLTMPLLWPPFADVPVSKTLDDLKRLKEEIMPKVEAGIARCDRAGRADDGRAVPASARAPVAPALAALPRGGRRRERLEDALGVGEACVGVVGGDPRREVEVEEDLGDAAAAQRGEIVEHLGAGASQWAGAGRRGRGRRGRPGRARRSAPPPGRVRPGGRPRAPPRRTRRSG